MPSHERDTDRVHTVPAATIVAVALIFFLTAIRTPIASAQDAAPNAVHPVHLVAEEVLSDEYVLEASSGLSFLEDESPDPNVVEVSLTAAPMRLSLLPGPATEAYAFNGRIPGPVLDVREGDHVIVHFHNALPEPSTIHWHG